jgi:hypothetical protein
MLRSFTRAWTTLEARELTLFTSTHQEVRPWEQAVEIIDFSVEDYDFKKASQKNIRVNIEPILKDAGFRKYKPTSFVRERKSLAQIVFINPTKYRVEAWASFLLLYEPRDYAVEFGTQLVSGGGLTGWAGKEYNVVLRVTEHHDKAKQVHEYYEQHVPDFQTLTLVLRDIVIPEMDRIDSLNCFMHELADENARLFGRSFYGRFFTKTSNDFNSYILGVHDSLSGN